MIDFTPLYFLIIFIIGYCLIKASISDYDTRKVPIKTWQYAVYIALPLSFIPLACKIWDGTINIVNPLQTFAIIYPLFIIGLMFFLASISERYFPSVNMGGADCIAITIILLTLIPMDLKLPICYMIWFTIMSITWILFMKFYWNTKKDYKIPLLLPITIAYAITITLYFAFGSGAFPLI